MRMQSDTERYVKVYSVKLLDGFQVKFVVKIPNVITISGFNLMDSTVKVPKLVDVHRLNPKNKDLQVQLLLKAINGLPEYALLVDNSSYNICLGGTIIFRGAILVQDKPVHINSAEIVSHGSKL